MAEENGVMLLNFWVSPFGQRVKIALAEKGIEYEYKEENLMEKSSLLLKSNPIHKKIPVLIHDGKPISESIIIVEYIDETWPSKTQLLPSAPYARAQSRFWADFIDKKVFECGTRLWKCKGEAQEQAKKEMIETLKLLETDLGDKKYFGGESFGLVDLALIPFSSWFHAYETCCPGLSIEKECPKLIVWIKNCKTRESVSKSLPEPNMIYEFVCNMRKRFGIE